jgi:antitoxin component of RelBE/YafQ-DinJ toxin-antitoxin module
MKTEGIMASLTIHNIDSGLKTAAMEIMKNHGMTAKDTISAFLAKIVSDHSKKPGTCFCCDLELNDETKKDLREAKAGNIRYTACSNPDELFSRLGI